MTASELATATNRSSALQGDLEAVQNSLEESCAINDGLRKREETLRKEHSEEIRKQTAEIERLREEQTKRLLLTHRVQVERYEKSTPNTKTEIKTQSYRTRAVLEPGRSAPAQTAAPGPPAPPALSTPMDTSEEREVWEERVNGKEMQQYRALRPCLRRPGGWGRQCRMLHVAAGKSHKHHDFIDTDSQKCCRGAETLLERTTSRGGTEERAREDRAPAPGGTCGKEEGASTVPGQGEGHKVTKEELAKTQLQEAQDQIKLQVQKPLLLKGAEGGTETDGEADQEAQEVREAWTRPPREILYSRSRRKPEIKNNILYNTCLIENLEDREVRALRIGNKHSAEEVTDESVARKIVTVEDNPGDDHGDNTIGIALVYNSTAEHDAVEVIEEAHNVASSNGKDKVRGGESRE